MDRDDGFIYKLFLTCSYEYGSSKCSSRTRLILEGK